LEVMDVHVGGSLGAHYWVLKAQTLCPVRGVAGWSSGSLSQHVLVVVAGLIVR
jgi:hypothetical protein